MSMGGTLLSLGHGYSARALARRLGSGWRVIGTTRSPEKAADHGPLGPVVAHDGTGAGPDDAAEDGTLLGFLARVLAGDIGRIGTGGDKKERRAGEKKDRSACPDHDECLFG